jgi:hypothetical protein
MWFATVYVIIFIRGTWRSPQRIEINKSVHLVYLHKELKITCACWNVTWRHVQLVVQFKVPRLWRRFVLVGLCCMYIIAYSVIIAHQLESTQHPDIWVAMFTPCIYDNRTQFRCLMLDLGPGRFTLHRPMYVYISIPWQADYQIHRSECGPWKPWSSFLRGWTPPPNREALLSSKLYKPSGT